MAPRKGAKQAATEADEIVIAAADSNVSPSKKKTTAKTIVEKPKQAKAGTRRGKAADKRENEVIGNEAASPVKKLRGRAKKVVTAVVSPKSPAKTINNSTKNKSKKTNKQKIKTNTEENNDEEVLQITEKKTRARATTKKAGAVKKLPAKSKTTLSTAKRSKKETAIENGAGDAESAGDEGPAKTTRRRKAVEKSVAPVAKKSKTTKKRKSEDNKNFDNDEIIEKEKNTEPVAKKSRRANKLETGAGDVVKLNQDVKVIKPKEKTKKKTAKKPDASKPETSIGEKIETTEEEENSQNVTLQEDNMKEKSIKRTVTRRKPNTVTVTESKSKKRKVNVNKKAETKKQKKEQTITDEDDIIIDYAKKEDLAVNKNSTLNLDETVTEDNNLSGNDNTNNSKDDSMNSSEIKANFTEIERSPSFLSL
ncbi:uncharacterized protein LOC109852630 [Pseudomyrmex gracilis]|uniref:uncharacterized protein LOC109852630 n=1 Tax=Pseudomyrmex gracilis TaxID=219809 RepID=UPI000994F48B|nr:uncharacterized protein LOC109852630 [Pseudomyrmex gracilis]